MTSSEEEMNIDESYSSSEESSDTDISVSDEISETSNESDTNDNQNPPLLDMPWTDEGIPRPPFPFTVTSGVQMQHLSSNNILEIFETFFDDTIMEVMVRETNRYASQYLANPNIKEQSRVKKWKETNVDELRTLLGVLILQSVTMKPEYKMYFSRRESIETPFFLKIFTEKRFHLLMKFLHFVDNQTIDATTANRKLAKLGPVLDHLRKKFMTVYIPERNIAIDESMIGWKGRLGWKQYIPSKRKRFGIKVFALCESSSGYFYNFIFYTGSDTKYGTKYENEPKTSRVVLELVDSLLDKGYCLFLDNYYTSVDLVQKLVKKRTDCIGTMRINRKGLPKEIKVKLKKGDSVAMYKKKIMVQKWKDKKDVLMISTLHDKTMKKIQTRHGEAEKPSCVVDYNQQMGGVDLSDQCLHFYSTSRTRVRKYYMKIFQHFLSLTTLNSFHIYKKLGGKKKRLNFLIELGEKIIEKYAKLDLVERRRSKTPKPTRLMERHFPSIIPPTTKQKPTKR